MARLRVKSEDFDDGNSAYRSRASSPTTPRRATRSSSKRPAEMVGLTERSPRSIKKNKMAAMPVPVEDDKNESDEDEYTSGECAESTEDEDEKLVKKQLANVQKEQQRKADIERNELHERQRQENRRRERERFERLAKHRKEQQKLKEREESQRRKQENQNLERLEKERKAKEAREKKRLEEEDQRKKKLFRQQESLDMYKRVKERMDQERLAKEHKAAEEKRDRILAEEREERLSKIRQAGIADSKKLKLDEEDEEEEEEEDDDEEEHEDEDKEDEGSENEDEEDEGDEDERDEEPTKKVTEKTIPKEYGKDEGGGEEENPFLGANVPDLANDRFCACIHCIKGLTTSPLFSCKFTDDSDKCARCSSRGRSCKPVPTCLHDTVCKLLALQKRYDAADPKSRESLRIRIQSEASAIAEKVRVEGSPRRKTQENTYRAILFGQVEIKHNQEEILKLLRSFLPGHSAEGKVSALSDRIAKQKKRA